MRQQEAEDLLNKTFNQDFKIEKFSQFVKELFNEIDINVEDKTSYIGKQYKDHIADLKKFGEYQDNDRKRIEVLAVKLERPTSLDRARTMQRNFIANWLGKTDAEGALVAFYDADHPDWRFSFVKMEYGLVRDEEGKVIVSQKLTPARRYSYLVGVNEPNHTCRSQFLDLVKDEVSNPALSDLEQAFSIESVTKEFFEKYKELVFDLKESIDKVVDQNETIKKEFDEKLIKPIDFAKKLLGQIVFLYFLQKKGWLGVEKGEKWGTGPHNFLRRLFGDKEKGIDPLVSYDNFFNEILKLLFYDALAHERPGDDGYYFNFKCKIPFLNGGLFEPLNDYDWIGTEILIENDVFERIFKVFDRFNFTVKEDEPLDKEVAVDPEMLGKVFENLLELKERKDKGAFYTPREIVHYMCQQSLINYLETNIDIKREDIETFIQYGDLALEHVIKDLEQQKTYNGQSFVDEEFLIPESISYNFRKIDRLLKNIKIVDPAVGSGAFPVGMMNEIVKARSILTIYFSEEEQKERTNYNFKRETIANSLYGVDIDQSGVEIAKLRFWLSLIVDETDMNKIKPLPNLDHKVMCGNSLLEEFEGIKLFDDKLLGSVKKDKHEKLKEIDEQLLDLDDHLKQLKSIEIGKKRSIAADIKKLRKKREKVARQAASESTEQISLGITESEKKIKTLRGLQKKYFNEQNRKNKRELRSKIDKLEWDLIEVTLKEENHEEALEKLEQYRRTKVKPFFLWKLYFAEVFQRENPGFDVVIANPPYIGEKGHKEMFREIAKTNFGRKYYNAKMDIFYFFLHRSIDIGKNNCIISFITTNYYITATGAKKLRTDFKNRTTILQLLNFNELKIFDSARGQHNIITILEKSNSNKKAFNLTTNNVGLATSNVFNSILSGKDINTSYYKIEQSNLFEGNDNYIRISGSDKYTDDPIGCILNKMKHCEKVLGDICYINSGCDITISRITKKHLKKFDGTFSYGDGVFVLSRQELENIRIFDEEYEIIKNFIKNSDIQPYGINISKDKLIYLRWEDNINKYPNIKNHLLRFEEILKDQADRYEEEYPWYALHRPRDQNIFKSDEKIVVPYRNKKNIFGYTKKEVYSSRDVFFITKKDEKYPLKLLLGILNSKLIYVWLYKKGKRKGETLELYHKPLTEIPIPKVSEDFKESIICLVNEIIDIYDNNSVNDIECKKINKLLSEIDEITYNLYELKPDEIKIVKEFCGRR